MMVKELWQLPDTWRWIELGEISEVVSKGTTPTTVGYAFTETGIPFLRAEDITGGAINPNTVAFHIGKKTHSSVLSRSQLQPGDLLITIAGTLGRVGYVPFNAQQLNCNQAVAFARLRSNLIDVQFACFACQYDGLISTLIDRKKVGTIGNLNLQQIQEFRLPLPPLFEQKRIAAILAKADRLRRLRKYALELSGKYLQTVFLEMFGDPVTNPMGWEIFPLGDLLSLSPHLGTITPAKESGKQLCVRVGEVGEWQINLNKCQYVSLEEKEFKRFSLQPDDIVLARAIGSEAHLGKLSIMGKSAIPVVFDSHLMRIRTDPSRLLTFFLACWLKTDGGRARFMQQARQTSVQFNINTEQIGSIEMPVPPLSMQQKFAKVIQKHLRLQAQQREALRQAEHLFQTLLHKAFQGELSSDEVDISMPVVEKTFDQSSEIPGMPEHVSRDSYQLALPLE